MAEKAPVDQYGMPYAIAPAEPVNNRSSLKPEEHHAFYCEAADELQDTAGLAVRDGRVHELPEWLHKSFHSQFPDGLERQPQTEQEKFGLLVLSLSGYLSRDGWVKRPSGTFELASMDDATYKYVRNPKQMHLWTKHNSRLSHDLPKRRTQDETLELIAGFLIDYALQQDMNHLKDTPEADEFLHSSGARRFDLGHGLLKGALRVAIEPVEPVFNEVRKQGLVYGGVRDLHAHVTRFPFTGDWSMSSQLLAQRLAA